LSRSAASGGLFGKPLSRRSFIAGASLAVPLIGGLPTPAARAATPVKGGNLVMGLGGGGASDSLDPTKFSIQVQRHLGLQFGNLLLDVAPSGEVVGELAESWDMLDDGNRWVFKLRRGVEFSNGKSLAASDVVYSMVRHWGPGSKSGAKGQMEEIADIKATGPQEVTFTLHDKNVDFHYLFTDYHLVIQAEGEDSGAGIGTGPYIIDSANPGVRYQLHRNPNYWRSDRAHVDTLDVRVINDPTARLAGLRTGELHIVNLVDPRIADSVASTPGLSVTNTPGHFFNEYLMHCNTPPFDNADVRLALKYAVDREMVVDKILRGRGRIGNDHPISPTLPLFAEDIPQRIYDPDKARFHFKKSGYDGSILLHTATTAFPGANDAAALFSQNAAKAGIQIDIKVESPDGYAANIWSVVPFCATAASCRATQDLSLTKNFLSTAVWNNTKWFRPPFDKLLLQARAEHDAGRRKAIYREAVMMLRDDGGIIVPVFPNYLDGSTSKVKGLIDDPSGELCNYRAAQMCWLEA
jgi:peptide/nickel transport system substrate-binding protein